MVKEKVSRKTKYTGIYIYDPDSKKKRYYISSRYGKNPVTGKAEVISRKVDRDGSHITSIVRAQEYLQELKDEIDQSRKLNCKDQMTYRDFVEKIDKVAHKTEVRKSTYEKDQTLYNRLLAQFGEKQLRDITVNDVENYKVELSKDKKNQ